MSVSIIHRLTKTTCVATLMAWSLFATQGCFYRSMKSAANSMPASRLDYSLLASSKASKVPILYSALGQDRPEAYRVGAGDTLAIYVYGVIPATVDETPVLSQYQTLNQRYYPPGGSVEHPTTGVPVTLDSNGALQLPFIGSVPMSGLTLAEVRERLIQLYNDASVVIPGRERVSVNLVTKRVHRITVLRQDSPNPQAIFTAPAATNQIHRGSGEVIDLPTYENDVLHALASTGGLPGTDAAREVWVLRRCAISGTTNDLTVNQVEKMIGENQQSKDCGPSVIRIPLLLEAGDALPFSPQDVILESGDVVYVPRRLEYFYTGGLLNGAKIPLPADEDVDVIQAIAIATNSIGGPLGSSGEVLRQGNPGWVVAPTRAIVLRKLADGSQISIRVDLNKAVQDERERLLIQPDDLIMLYHKPVEGTANFVLNWPLFNAGVGKSF